MCSLATIDPIDYLVIGHIAQDLTPDGPKMGGTAAYAGLTAHALGLRVGVVTSWGAEIPLGPMENISIVNHLAEHSTTFENVYHSQGRVQTLHHKAGNLDLELIPQSWRDAPIVHLGPIAQEVDPKLASQFPKSLLGVTPQGWLRSWDEQGQVHPTKWPAATSVLKSAQAILLSVEDVAFDETQIEEIASLCPILVVTEGANGARVYWHGDVRRFQAPQMDERDATGAGDIFAAAFLIQLHKTRDPWEAARFANCLASQSVSRPGLMGVPTREEIQAAIVEVI
jgi:sugar/nucleoside kinase (ribokinase family)